MLRQSPRILMIRRMIGWLEALLSDPPEWMSPYALREFRVLVRLAHFGVPLIILVAASWFLTFQALVDPSLRGRMNSLYAMQMLFAFYAANVTPFVVLSGFRTGKDPERDLIRLVPQSGLGIVAGKLWAACAVNSLYALATLPFFAAASILQGAPFAGGIGTIVFAICVGVAQADFAIMCGSISNPLARILGMLVLFVSGCAWTIGIELLNAEHGFGIAFVWLAFQAAFLIFVHGIVVAQLQQTGPYLLPVPYEPNWAGMVARVAQRFVTAVSVLQDPAPGAGVLDQETAALQERALRTAAQQLTQVLNPGPNLWSGLGCRCALSRTLQPVADEVAFAAQGVFERLGCLEPLLLRNSLHVPLWTDSPPAIPRDELARLQRAIHALQAWSDRHMPRS